MDEKPKPKSLSFPPSSQPSKLSPYHSTAQKPSFRPSWGCPYRIGVRLGSALNIYSLRTNEESKSQILIEMSKIILLLVLIVDLAAVSRNRIGNYELSPPLPPAAFRGQYYTCQFYVQGITPVFHFYGLPGFLGASEAGAVEGTPNATGTYRFTVVYTFKDVYGQEDIVLRVMESSFKNVLIGKQEQKGCPKIKLKTQQFIYELGDAINMPFEVTDGVQPYQWTYLLMPDDLEGSGWGQVTGAFYEEGLYTFGVSVSDGLGRVTDAFFTLNVQPLFINYDFRIQQYLRSVPNRNQPTKYSLKDVVQLQTAAYNNLYETAIAARNAKDIVQSAKELVAKTQANIAMSVAQVKAQENYVKDKLIDRYHSLTNYQSQKKKVSAAQNLYELAVSGLKIAQEAVRKGQEVLKQALEMYEKLKEVLRKVSEEFIDKQNGSAQAATKVEIAQLLLTDAKNSLNDTFESITLGRQFLQKAKNDEQNATFKVNSIENEKNLAEYQNDQVMATFNSAVSAEGKAKQTLQKNNDEIDQLRASLNNETNQLGAAKYNLTQALNQLYIAQAAKEQIDKTVLLASLYENKVQSGNTTYIFQGCQAGNYPTISGSVQVKTASASYYELLSGQILTFGGCSQVDRCGEGEVAVFEGYLRDGVIHASRISKL